MVDIARDKIWVIEFNARFGDPETQVLMPRIEGEILQWYEASARARLSAMPERVPFVGDTAVVVVGAAKGYPDAPEKGVAIEGLRWESPEGASIFWAGVKRVDGALVSNGGRVFGSVGTGRDLEQARSRAYVQIKQIGFKGMQYRRDIGYVRV
jgi:phosphoribosylamine--glycine ligase